MVKTCPNCTSNNISFIESGENTGKHFCENCGFVGEVVFNPDEFQD